MADVTLHNVKKQFGAVSVIKGVNLTIANGEFCGLRRPFRLRKVDAAAHDRGP
jgi:ABC-type branched-subunit amino acid transport system ATPase component